MADSRRRTITKRERSEVFARTRGRCHVCGGALGENWVVDHVEPHAKARDDGLDNMLAAHAGCNRFRWFYEPEVIQVMAELAVYATAEILGGSALGSELEALYLRRVRKRKTVGDPAERLRVLKERG